MTRNGSHRPGTSTEPAARCPYPHPAGATPGRRKSGRGDAPSAPGVANRDGTWHLRSYAAVRQVLRDADGVRQAAADALEGEAVVRTELHQPVIFQDGAPHREQRSAIARFFTPRAVDESYRAVIEGFSDALIAELRSAGRGDLSALSMRLAVQVTAQVVGLTDSLRPGMDRRISSLLSLSSEATPSRLRRAARSVLSRLHALSFFLLDVRPAIRARRKAPREDVISHLVRESYTPVEILIECMTYAAAGMVTTREFIGMAAWHLLEDEPLRSAYLAAGKEERQRILHEILRLEPVAGHLYRRATRELRIESDGSVHRIPAGSLLDLHIRAANADPHAVGEDPLRLDPRRDLPRGVQPPVVSFGDGAHRCPGAFLAIEESDVFLQRLLRLPLRMARAPELSWNDTLNSYELRDFVVELATPAETRAPATR